MSQSVDDRAVSRHERERRALANLALRLVEADTSEALARALADATDHLFQWDAFVFLEHAPGTTLYRRILAFDTGPEGRIALGPEERLRPHPDEGNSPGDANLINRSHPEEAADRYERFGDVSRLSASLMFVPIRLGKDSFGVLSVQSYTPERYNEQDLELLKAIGDVVAPAMRRILAERELRESEDRYRRAIAQAEAVPYEKDRETGRLVYMGEGIQAITGYTAEELTRELWRSMVQEVRLLGDLAGLTLAEAMRRSREGEVRTWRAEYRIRNRNGEDRWIADSAVNLYDGQGRFTGSLGILQDISERKRSELLRENLIRLGQRLSAAADSREAARCVADTAFALIGWDACSVLMLAGSGASARSLCLVERAEGEIREHDPVSPELALPAPGVLRDLTRGRGVIRDCRAGEEPLFAYGGHAAASRSLVAAPIRDRSADAIGLVVLHSRTAQAYSEESIRLLELLADYCASSIARTQAEEALRENERRYRQAIAQADAVPYERDYRSNAITYMGEGIERLTGYPAEEVDAAKLDGMIQEVALRGEAAGLSLAEADRKARHGEILVFHADYRIRDCKGSERWLADTSVPVLDDQRRPIGSLGILQDITERMRAGALNNALSRLGLQMSATTTPREVALVVVQAADELIGWDACFLNLLDPGTGGVECVLSIDTLDGRREECPENYQRSIPPSPIFQRTLHEGPQLVLRDRESSAEQPPCGSWGAIGRRSESLMFVPVREKGRNSIGVVSIQSYRPRAFSERDLETLQILADHCSGALERTQAESRLRASEQRATAFAELANRLNSAKTPADAGAIITRIADEILGWDACDIDLYSPEEDVTYDILNIDTVDGVKVVFPSDSRPKKATSLTRRALREGAFLIHRTEEELRRNRAGRETVRFGDRGRLSASLLFVPARKGDRVVGVISIQSYTPGAYGDQDLQTLQALADHCGGAFERILAENRLARERLKMAAFAELGRKLSATSTAKEAGKIIVDAARDLLGWDSCFLLLYSEDKDFLVPVFAVDFIDGAPTEVPHEHFEGEPTGYTAMTIREGKQIVLRSPEEGERETTLGFGDLGRRSASLLFVPILKESSVIAVLSIQSYEYNAYTVGDLDLLDSLAQHCSDALERIQMEQALRESEERYALAAQGANDGLWDWNLLSGEVHYSTRLRQMLGYEAEEFGDDAEEWMRRVHSEDLAALKEQLEAHFKGDTDHFENEHRLLNRDGAYLWVLCRGLAVRNDAGKAVRIAGSMTDITLRRAAEDQLFRAAFYDSLTGLPNRSLFLERLGRSILRHKRKPDTRFAVFFLDLDHFKKVNDTLGHLMGDKLLVQAARRLVQNVREGDTVARMGGDEFTILLDDLRDAAEAEHVAARLLSEFARPFLIDGREVHSGTSIGIALSLTGYSRADDILRDADNALYRAKRQGRGVYVFHDPGAHAK